MDCAPEAIDPASSTEHLPSELWLAIFRHATSIERFFDSRWWDGFVDAFEDADKHPKDAFNAFTESLRTRKTISLVCRSWNHLSSRFLFAHLVVRRLSQLRPLVHMLERSHDEAVADGRSNGIGWWITHINLIVMDYKPVRGRTVLDLVSYDANCGDVNSLIVQYLRRLLACCPRLEILLDATHTNGLANDHTPLRSLEWNYGGPAVDDLIANPEVVNHLRSLRCYTIHDSEARINFSPAELPNPPSLSIILLPFMNLTSLDLCISQQNHAHLSLLSCTDLPSIAYFTIRTAQPIGILVGSNAILALQSFFASHGHKLLSLDLRICPGDIPPPRSTTLLEEEAVRPFVHVPTILGHCPNLKELILSARWFALHSPSFSFLQSDSDDGGGANAHTSPLLIPHHLNIERIGLRDTSWRAEGYSQANSEAPCLSCSRPLLVTPLTDPGRGDGERAQLTLSHRHCTVDRHLRMILGGFKPVSATVKDQVQHIPPTSTARRRARLDDVAQKKRFPSLVSIHLLDSHPDMFELKDGKCNSWRTCWCTPLAARTETSFWAAWAAKCTERNVKLLDRHGNPVPSYPPNPYTIEDNLDRRPVADLDEELRDSLMKCCNAGGVESLWGLLDFGRDHPTHLEGAACPGVLEESLFGAIIYEPKDKIND
ncbi:uncharacterized protein EI90DRAFT_3013683 [Cantharellus anzutake]|uniref:uncharacterized protein n=1 Tax=Cantharellus anzutake TaxID=1750568 RepID=UPI00190458BA|nr:uncharacterized protein EI90DRAFT_3013683 [Cantharellus anzutake]KAF8337472.1 hypothetical protein EI90DRAFT_3013683 [Cantharellus anzutake]